MLRECRASINTQILLHSGNKMLQVHVLVYVREVSCHQCNKFTYLEVFVSLILVLFETEIKQLFYVSDKR